MKVFNINEAASVLGISRSMLYKLWSINEGPARIKIGRRTLVSEADLKKWLDGIKK